MSHLRIAAATLAATLLAATQALAVTITNRDSTPYTVQVQTGGQLAEVAVPAGGEAEQPCEPECILRVAGLAGEESAAGDDSFIIYEGKLHKEEE